MERTTDLDRLILCASCARHVRASEAQCPFCAAPARATRASGSTVAVAIAVGMALAGCDAMCQRVRVPGVCSEDGLLADRWTGGRRSVDGARGTPAYGGPYPAFDEVDAGNGSGP